VVAIFCRKTGSDPVSGHGTKAFTEDCSSACGAKDCYPPTACGGGGREALGGGFIGSKQIMKLFQANNIQILAIGLQCNRHSFISTIAPEPTVIAIKLSRHNTLIALFGTFGIAVIFYF